MNKGYEVPEEDKKFIYNELYYKKKDRSYWFYLNRFLDSKFYNFIKKDINSLQLNYNGNQFIELIKYNLKKLQLNNNNLNNNFVNNYYKSINKI